MSTYSFLTAFFFISIFSFNTMAESVDSGLHETFSKFDKDSKFSIDYTDLDSLLNALVLDTGRSDRKKARPSQSQTGTRIKASTNRATVYEGNRFFFEIFVSNPQYQQFLQNIRGRLENIPSITPLERYSRDEQLAYWINLYNVTLLDEIVKTYPQRDLRNLLVGEDSVLSKKLLRVAGVPLSLNDIQYDILMRNYGNNPLLIYGLYQGNIGSPSIRKSAYTGKHIYDQLNDNASEFINSNRGAVSQNSHVFRVSSLYQRNRIYFDNFENDLTRHLLQYLQEKEAAELQAATRIEADINDWTITDLYGSSQDFAGSFANGSAVLGSDTLYHGNSEHMALRKANEKYTPEVLEHLIEFKRKREDEKIGTVTLEELGTAQPDAASNN